ncbi:hypothetical protein DFP72DRAFT_917641 [Ephemerocybe angulata]|uniref:Lysine-specific metallo-endopeptidase domain-containing protein n=1 Tax=Ephemerocybe angulata TaxID=980116 RepID=A0A8H6HKM7_9AGAR|nr:hypothetical protein DFP72DRAFT_917641 [Tulosesus angulatus]
MLALKSFSLLLASALVAGAAPALNDRSEADSLKAASWPTFQQCEGRETVIAKAANDAQILGKATKDYVASLKGPTPRYTTWFGNLTSARYATVLNIYSTINTNDYLGYTYICDCDLPSLPEDVVAYVYPYQHGKVHLCPEFFRRNTTGKNTQHLHEATHFSDNGATEDWVSGTDNSLKLAIDDPDKAINNAANYKYFAENVPFLN